MIHDSSMLAWATLSLLVLAVYKLLLHPVFVSPLRKIPNAHWSSAISPLWILWVRWHGKANRTIDEAHDRLGPVIRLGPNELNVNCIDNGVRTIYTGGFDKHRWYPDQFQNFGLPNMFTMLHNKAHSDRKRVLSHIYSKSFLQSSPAMASICRTLVFSNLLPFLRDAARKSEPINAIKAFDASSLDFITAYIFGLKCYARALPQFKEKHSFLERYGDRSLHSFWPSELPTLTQWATRLGLTMVPTWVDNVSNELENWTLEMCNSAEEVLDSENGPASEGDMPTVYAKLRSTLQKTNEKHLEEQTQILSDPTRLEIASEVLDHLAAGLETSGITLTYLTFELSTNPTVQTKLRQELLTLSLKVIESNEPDLPSLQELDSLPFLHAVVMETLRLHPAIPGNQPRLTPEKPCVLGQYGNVPGGVRVNAQAYSLHKHADAFPRASEWIPERWIGDGLGREAERKKWFWAFGSGGRMCIGSHFAMQAMKLTVAAIYSGYTTSIVGDERLEQRDMYTAAPINPLHVRFAPL